MKALWQEMSVDESGFILSAELILIVTIGVLGLVAGLSCIQQALVYEMQDVSMAIQSLNQSFATPSYRGCMKWWGRTSWVSGSSFIDVFDGCIGTGAIPTGGAAYGYSEIIGGSGTTVTSQGSGYREIVTPPVNSLAVPQTTPCETCPQTSDPVLTPPSPLVPTPAQH